MKKILVTGAAGFIGWKVSDDLLERGFHVTGIDNLNDYYDPSLKRWRLDTLGGKKNFKFHLLDIADYEKLKEVFSLDKPDAVINLAARAGVRASLEDPWVYLDTNVKGTLNLLECLRSSGVKKFVLASTSSIYGLNKMPFKEESIADCPLAPYAATKKAAELLCHSYHYIYKIDTIIPRYFTVYGPAGRPDMSYFRFIKNIDAGIPIPVFGDGTQRRDFTFIEDISEATIRCLDAAGYEVVNLGNDKPVELNYVISLIEENLGKKAKIKRLPLHPADVPATRADIEKSKKLLAWKPRTSIEEGIQKTVRWYLDNRQMIQALKE